MVSHVDINWLTRGLLDDYTKSSFVLMVYTYTRNEKNLQTVNITINLGKPYVQHSSESGGDD